MRGAGYRFSTDTRTESGINQTLTQYNIGQVAIGVADTALAYQAFKVAISLDPNHAESFTNLGVLELRRRNVDAATSMFGAAQELGPHLFQGFYNGALLAHKLGKMEEAYGLVKKSLALHPEHADSKELHGQLLELFRA